MSGNFSLAGRDDEECVFYNEEYEEDLLSVVGLSPAEPCHFLEKQELLHVNADLPKPYADNYAPETNKKRGRPMKADSKTKMAVYSRQYREAKKQELSVSLQRAAQLEREKEELYRQLQDAIRYSHELYNYVQSQQQSTYWPRSAPTTPTKMPF